MDDDAHDPRTTPTGGTPDDATTPGTTQDDVAAPEGRATSDDDAAVLRVRATDPAVDAAPDTARLHERITALTGVPLGGDAATPGDDLAEARARRRRPARWLQVAAVAAGVALVGGGGYAVGAAGADEPAAPPIALGGAPGGAQEMAAADARIALPGWGGRTVFHGSGLDGAAGTARAWAFDPSGVATAETAARVAAALGVPGEPRDEWGQWVVGANDGTGATVAVGVDGQASMWFYDRAWDPSTCMIGEPHTLDGQTLEGPTAQGRLEGQGAAGAEPGVAEPALPGAEEGTAPEQSDAAPETEAGPLPEVEDRTVPLPAPEVAPSEPAPADPSVCDPGSTPRGDAAIARAREVVASLGVDLDAYELTVDSDTGVEGLVSVTAAQVVDGTQTALGWNVQLAGTGVLSVSGPLAPLVELGEYRYVSADEAVERLNDPRFGASFGGVMPLARAAGGDAGIADDSAAVENDRPTVPPVPAAGDPIAWPVQDVTLTKARLGVTQLSTPSGALLLVPAWELTDTDGGTWSVVAVVEDQLDLGGD